MREKLLHKQTWMITGITSGIGLALSRQLLQKGVNVIGIVRKLDRVPQELIESEKLIPLIVDVSDIYALDSAVKETLQQNKVDVIVSNAGMSIISPTDELSLDIMEKIVSTNLLGSMAFIKAVIPYFKENGGKIIQIGSSNSIRPAKECALYCATKYGILGFCESVNLELKPYDVSVSVIEPGPVNTPLWSKIIPSGVENKDGYMGQAKFAEISVEKLARRIITISQMEPMPLYVPLGEKTGENISNTLRKRLKDHEKMREFAGDVDTSYRFRKPEHLNGRKIYIWPCGSDMKAVFQKNPNIDEIADVFEGFADSDVGKVNDIFYGKKVVSPKNLFENRDEFYILIGSEKYFYELKKILEEHDFREKSDFCLWKESVEVDE